MPAPEFFPEWATTDVNLPNTGGANKSRPDITLREVGWDLGNKPAAEQLNWQLNNLFDWVQYLNDEGTASTILTITEKIPEPATPAVAVIYVDSADGDLKVKFANDSIITLASGPV